MYIHVYIHIISYVIHMYISYIIHIYVCMYVYTHIQERQGEKETGREKRELFQIFLIGIGVVVNCEFLHQNRHRSQVITYY